MFIEDLEQFLKSNEINSNYICIVSIHYVPLILDVVRVVFNKINLDILKMHVEPFQAKSMHLMTAENSWLIIIPDIDSSRSNISSITTLLSEGENISFIYNTTKTDSKCTVSLYLNIFYNKIYSVMF